MKKNNKGFTLAELLIVMAIIAVLAAIAIPSFSRQLESARETSDLNELRADYSEAMTLFMTKYSAKGVNQAKIYKNFAPDQKTAGWAYVDVSGDTMPWSSCADISADNITNRASLLAIYTFTTNASNETTCAITFDTTAPSGAAGNPAYNLDTNTEATS